VADPAAHLVVRGTPPAALRITFESVARGLRAIGGGRYLIADAAGTIAYALQPPRRRRLSAHLHSRGAGGLAPAEARRRARASYRNYARMIVDTIWIHAYRLDEMDRVGRVEGVEHLHDARDAGRGGILVLVHFGSWDTAASVVLATGHAISTVMAPVGPPAITELLAWSRKTKQMELFTPEAAARGLLRALRRGRLVALLVDIPEGGPTTEVRFRNGPVRFSTGPAVLARVARAPILPAECWRTTDGRYIVRIHPPYQPAEGQDDPAVMQHVAGILEQKLAELPDQWYPFNPIYVDEA
jgi:KDO2-lipid IV(A) lauroyltransferase